MACMGVEIEQGCREDLQECNCWSWDSFLAVVVVVVVLFLRPETQVPSRSKLVSSCEAIVVALRRCRRLPSPPLPSRCRPLSHLILLLLLLLLLCLSPLNVQLTTS